VALTDEERAQVRRHLGYPNVAAAAMISYGMVRSQQTLFLVELAMTNLTDEGADEVRTLIAKLNDIECLLFSASERLAVASLEGITLRENEPDRLEQEFVRWAHRLSEVLGAPVYPYARRFMSSAGVGQAGSVPVRH
jgi:hypothetical protein